MLAEGAFRRTAVAMLCLVAGGCASVGVVDPVRDDGSAGFAAACVGVLAAEQVVAERSGAAFSIDEHRALNEWMFQASRRSSLFDNEIGRAAERRRWAETLNDDGRARRLKACTKELGV